MRTSDRTGGAVEAAETLALQALGWILADPERLSAFLAASGAGPADLARGARDPAFLGAVIDFLLQTDAGVLAFCAEAGLAPDRVLAARAALPGGDLPHWT